MLCNHGVITKCAIIFSQSLTAVSLSSTSLRNLTLGGCCGLTSLALSCPYLEHVPLDGCDDLERASFSPVSYYLNSLLHVMCLSVLVVLTEKY